MTNTISTQHSRQKLIENGKFSVFKSEEEVEFQNIMNMIPSSSHFYEDIKSQLKEAFRFNESEMVNEIKSFVEENFVGIPMNFQF